jgi:hypothetical protein
VSFLLGREQCPVVFVPFGEHVEGIDYSLQAANVPDGNRARNGKPESAVR